MPDRCFYFGCWNESGHYFFKPGKAWFPYEERKALDLYVSPAGLTHHIDGTLAPRRLSQRLGGGLWWESKGATERECSIHKMNSGEYPQGQFLLHHVGLHHPENIFTAIQWWDRNQGDSRGACNSTILLEGKHTAEEMLAALAQHFPHVLENLKRAGVELVEVKVDV